MLRKFRVKLNGKEYMVEMEEVGAPAPAAAPVAQQPVSAPAPAAAPAAPEAPAAAPAPAAPSAPVSGTTMEAPMPGKVLKVLVAQGQTVRENDPIIILEAMKMENEIVAPKDGVIAALHVSEGQAINVGAPIATIG